MAATSFIDLKLKIMYFSPVHKHQFVKETFFFLNESRFPQSRQSAICCKQFSQSIMRSVTFKVYYTESVPVRFPF